MSLDTLLHGWSGLLAGYAAVQVPMLVAMTRRQAQLHHYALAPLVAVPLTGLAAAGAALAGASLPAMSAGLHAGVQLLLGAGVSAAVGYGGGRWLSAKPDETQSLRRGTVIIDQAPESSRGKGDGDRQAAISFAGIPVPEADEVKHFKLIGTTGTGKSTAIARMLADALRRGDRAVIADPDGGYMRDFYDPGRGDVILNPFDGRSRKWDLYGEIETPYDVDQLARSLIPDHDGPDRSWRAYARTFFSAVTRQSREAGIEDVGELYRLMVVAPTTELRTLVRGTPAQPFLEEHNARMFDSIRSVASSAVAALDFVSQQQGESLSVRQWVRDDKSRVLFIPYEANQIAALRSPISAWMRIAILETMNPGRDPERPMWFVVDELDALGQIDGLKDALARVKKVGGRVVLGFQSISQVSATYGHGEAHTIVENCSNTLLLRCSASEGGGTARFASQLVGDREVLRATHSTSRRDTEFFGSRSVSSHYGVEPALLPSQIEQLPDLVGYAKLASDPAWRLVALAPMVRTALKPEAGRLENPRVTRARSSDVTRGLE